MQGVLTAELLLVQAKMTEAKEQVAELVQQIGVLEQRYQGCGPAAVAAGLRSSSDGMAGMGRPIWTKLQKSSYCI